MLGGLGVRAGYHSASLRPRRLLALGTVPTGADPKTVGVHVALIGGRVHHR